MSYQLIEVRRPRPGRLIRLLILSVVQIKAQVINNFSSVLTFEF